MEIIGNIALFIILEDDADEFPIEADLGRIVFIRAAFDADAVVAEGLAQVALNFFDFALLHGCSPCSFERTGITEPCRWFKAFR